MRTMQVPRYFFSEKTGLHLLRVKLVQLMVWWIDLKKMSTYGLRFVI